MNRCLPLSKGESIAKKIKPSDFLSPLEDPAVFVAGTERMRNVIDIPPLPALSDASAWRDSRRWLFSQWVTYPSSLISQ
jgi:hypothetical protein